VSIIGLCRYQHSFYPADVPVYEGISLESPFICGKAPADPVVYDGQNVLNRLLARVAANPQPGPPEYGMLALGTGELRWAEGFREALMSEARSQRFVGPAYTVKSMQQDAALRAYFFSRVLDTFPGLFSDSDLTVLGKWFAAINHRAMSVEPVDWMYAIAFSKLPEGPYENQENGAGLLSLLEAEGLAAPELSAANEEYLQRHPLGWPDRFRNTDDTFVYQIGWLYNAYFQASYAGEAPEDHMRLSLEWLMSQALADGAPLRYNHPVYPSLASVAYLGARLLDDPRYIWLAGRALDYAEARGDYFVAQPGAEQVIGLSGRSPTLGSCLLYGDSGLPNQMGPLAPDKIVFRDGWREDDSYLLLNLRFTGWHRYKATNAIVLAYKDGPLASEVLDNEPFGWLPVGRSLFRDKRIPRENLNGLQVERSGLSEALYHLGGLGGPWAQDPPYYAEVMAFETQDRLDWSHTRLTDWHGWQHDRWVYFYHDGGPIVVVDSAEGPRSKQAALIWHLVGEEMEVGQGIRLRGDAPQAQIEVLTPDPEESRCHVAEDPTGPAGRHVVSCDAAEDKLSAITVFLTGNWVSAPVGYAAEEQVLRISNEQTSITLRVPPAE
jgi:hypothetical protein